MRMECCTSRNVKCRGKQSCFDTPPSPPQVKIPLEGCPSCPRASITLQLSSDPWVYRPEQAVRGALAMYRTPGPRTLVLQLLEGGGKLFALCVGGGGLLEGGGAAVIVVAMWGGAVVGCTEADGKRGEAAGGWNRGGGFGRKGVRRCFFEG